jgi:GNAT superfamily N-acetyltransferase
VQAAAEIRFARESMAAVLEEIKPLLWEHWAEIAHYADIPLDPNWPWYEGAEAAGQLRIYTVRDQRFALVGYCIYVVAPGLHYKSHTYANQDILFLLPEYRRGRIGRDLVRFTEGQLKGEGVGIVLQHVKVKYDFGPMLKRDGYEPIDTVYGKRL